jgi:hypothetical protein
MSRKEAKQWRRKGKENPKKKKNEAIKAQRGTKPVAPTKQPWKRRSRRPNGEQLPSSVHHCWG